MRNALWLLALTTTLAGARVAPLAPLTPVELPGVDVTAKDGVVTFAKTGAERRLVALACPPLALDWARSLSVRSSLTGFDGEARLAVVVTLLDGTTWYRLGSRPSATLGASRLALDGLVGAEFNPDSAKSPDRAKVASLRLGLVVEGAGRGVWTVASAAATDEPSVRTEPLRVSLGKPADWAVTKEEHVQHTVTLVPEGPRGEPVWRLDFTFPDPAHKWLIPGLPLPANEDYEGLTKLRLVYKANVAGPNLLFGIAKTNNAQYLIEPPPPATTDWRTLEVPLSSLKLGGWCKDDGGKLVVEPGAQIQTGCHGSSPAPGKGTIWVAEITLLP